MQEYQVVGGSALLRLTDLEMRVLRAVADYYERSTADGSIGHEEMLERHGLTMAEYQSVEGMMREIGALQGRCFTPKAVQLVRTLDAAENERRAKHADEQAKRDLVARADSWVKSRWYTAVPLIILLAAGFIVGLAVGVAELLKMLGLI